MTEAAMTTSRPGRLQEVRVSPLSMDGFEAIASGERRSALLEGVEKANQALQGRVVWNVNSTAAGGGVAEMLRSLLAYARGVGVDARWLVISGDPDFFRVTKRLHNHLHGSPGDEGTLGDAERKVYEDALRPNAEELDRLVGERDFVLLHDPQTAGLIPELKRRGHRVVWRCHIGIDNPNEIARDAWQFLLPYVKQADAYVFSRRMFVWDGLDASKTWLIAPSIDAFSPKNRELDEAEVEAILRMAGVVERGESQDAEFTRQDGTTDHLEHQAEMIETAALSFATRIVVQVSRWDRLKDPLGVIDGFAEYVAPLTDAHLVLAGPAVSAVADDPEGAEVLAEAKARWELLVGHVREKVHLACLPMEDGEENAAIVNALQRHATVIVQKSIAEGFGLTVAEAMWKAKPVVATRIGGIQDQVEHGATGLLLDDPRDLRRFGELVVELLQDPERAATMGREARARIRDEFLGDRHLLQYLELLLTLL